MLTGPSRPFIRPAFICCIVAWAGSIGAVAQEAVNPTRPASVSEIAAQPPLPLALAQTAVTARSATPSFVGSDACTECHLAQAVAWRASQHRQAMAHASETSVLGDFSGAVFDDHGLRSRFFRRAGKFMVETDGPDGKLAEFEIKYTFGIAPLQQYLIEFADGRLQALPIAWDSREKMAGGQRWFHLYPDEIIRHTDSLHWTKFTQNWNFMCAGCHSTGLAKTYDALKNAFETTWAEISVGCEACHGRGSAHVAWARDRNAGIAGKPDDPSKGLAVLFDERRRVADWSPDPTTGSPVEGRPLPPLRKEVETCGLCHARRSTVSEDWTPGHWLSDTQTVSSLRDGLYFPDGQMRDEVYTYGTFKQSKMFAKGVTCSDCHDPHSGKLTTPADGLCLGCHAEATFATPAHSHHAGVAPEPGCLACHMPTRVYMVVDARHDHGFRIPRPDLSTRLGTPNACNACHADKSPQWAAEAIKAWSGPNRPGFQDYAQAFHDTWDEAPHADALLAKIAADPQVPAFARGSALGALALYLSADMLGLARSGLADPDPMVRIGALDMLEGAPAAAIWPLAAPLLGDPVRGVRLRAVDLLAAVASARQPAADRVAFERAAREFIEAQTLNADRPDARVALGAFYARRGNAVEAEREFRAALHLVPQFTPAAIHLADLYRQMGRDAEGVAVLRATIAVEPAAANLRHALGLALIRVRQSPEALVQLGQAAALDRTNEAYAYGYAIALNAAGQSGEARKVLDDALARKPDNRRVLSALVAISRDANDLSAALAYAERLAKLYPDDREIARFIEALRGTVH